MTTRPDTVIVVPAYNEGAVLAEVLRPLLETADAAVVVVDDGSTDDTADVALRHPVTLLRHSCNLGQGAALQTGLRWARRRAGTRFVVTFDADGQHDAADVPRLLAPLRAGQCDAVLGTRFAAGAQAVDMPPLRRLLLRTAVRLTRLTTGLTVTDTHNGLRAFTVEAAARLVLLQNGMSHASEILAQVAAHRLRWCEVPVTVRYTSYSLTKGQAMSNGLNILWDTLRERAR